MTRQTALSSILRPGGLTPVFQPVVSARSSVPVLHYYESLMRGPQGTNMERADVMFEYVRLKREELTVDRSCVATIFRCIPDFPPATHFSINVHASTLGRDQRFASFLAEESVHAGVPLQRCTIEIVEHAPPWDTDNFLATLDTLRAMGLKIALDDVGLGQSNYKMILDVRADYLKIDRYFVTGCSVDQKRRAVIESIHQLATRFGAQVVAEGVETEADRDALLAIGIDLMQGYLYGVPLPASALVPESHSRPVTVAT